MFFFVRTKVLFSLQENLEGRRNHSFGRSVGGEACATNNLVHNCRGDENNVRQVEVAFLTFHHGRLLCAEIPLDWNATWETPSVEPLGS